MAQKLMQKSNTRKELLLNTCHHFNSNNRSQMPGLTMHCHYRLATKGCAIGREINDKLACKLDDFTHLEGGSSVENPVVFNQLPKRLQKMGQKFLLKIQRLHDDKDYWNEDGLTNSGLNQALIIANDFNIKVTKEELINR